MKICDEYIPGFSDEMIIKTIMDTSDDTIYFKDKQSRFLLNSRAHALQFGLDDPELLRGKCDYDFFPKQFADMAFNTEKEIMETGNPVVGKVERWEHEDNTVTWLLASKYPLYNEKGEIAGTWGTSRDITQLKKAESELEKLNKELTDLTVTQIETMQRLQFTQDQLIEKEKMAALGKLVAGIAHEINTPVGIGVTSISDLRKRCHEVKASLEENRITRNELASFLDYLYDSSEIISINLERASGLIHSFKKIAVDQSYYRKTRFDLEQYIKIIISSLKHELKHRKHEINIHADEPVVLQSYPGAFSQIFTNFIVNSLVHGYEEDELVKIDIYLGVKDDEIEIIFRDYGKGISDSVREHIFEPFFTTRFGHGGSGLGMSIVYNLVKTKLKGNIICENKDSNQGVQFRIQLPLTLLIT